MNTTQLLTVILGAGGALGALIAAAATVANFRVNRRKLRGEIQLDDATYKKIAADAASLTSQDRIKTEMWWKEQFEAVRDELKAEREWRRKTTRRLRAHQPWDHKILAKLGPDVVDLEPPPPLLDEDEDEA